MTALSHRGSSLWPIIVASIVAIVATLACANPAAAQGGACDDAVQSCCYGVSYWRGVDLTSGAQVKSDDGVHVDLVQRTGSFVTSAGRTDQSRRSRLIATIAATLGAFLFVLFMLWATARRQRLPVWSQFILLILAPGLVWYLVPEQLGAAAAHDGAQEFVQDIRRFCTGDAAGTKRCTDAMWVNITRSGEEDAFFPTRTCASLPPTTGALLEDDEGPCAPVCEPAVRSLGGSPIAPGKALRDRRLLVEDYLLQRCPDVSAAWRATNGPRPEDWAACTRILASDSYSRAVGQEFVLQVAWLGFAIGALLTLLAQLLLRRRRD